MLLFTYFLHFYEEGVNVVPEIVGVQVLFVMLYLLSDEFEYGSEVLKNLVVRTRQVLHHHWE